MPFIDDEQIAALYKEVDQEKKASAFFRDLHQKSKPKLQLLKWFQFSTIVLVLLLIIALVYNQAIPAVEPNGTEDPLLLERIQQLELENKILGGTTKAIQESLQNEKVFTVQIMASSNKDIMLFSEHFVNFRAHPLKNFNAYSLGNFSSEAEAEAFRQELISFGLPDVWVTSYQNGKRILIDRDE